MPEFARFVRVSPGHLVPRYGTTEFLGAERAGKELVHSGLIVPLTEDYCRRYRHELRLDEASMAISFATSDEWRAQGRPPEDPAEATRLTEGTDQESDQ